MTPPTSFLYISRYGGGKEVGKETQGMAGGPSGFGCCLYSHGQEDYNLFRMGQAQQHGVISPDFCLACCYVTLTCSSSATWLGGLCFNTQNEKRPKIFWVFPILTVHTAGMVSRPSIHCPCFTFRGNRFPIKTSTMGSTPPVP